MSGGPRGGPRGFLGDSKMPKGHFEIGIPLVTKLSNDNKKIH